jgi:hypothetical protein
MYCEGSSSSRSEMHDIDSIGDHVICEAEDAIAEIAEWCNAHLVVASEERARV